MSTWDKLSNKLRKAVPLLTGLLGGPAAKTAVDIITAVTGTGSMDEAAKVLESNPEMYKALQEAEMKHQEELIRLATEAERTRLLDVASARQREMSIVSTTKKKDLYLYALASVVVTGFFALTGILMFHPLPEGANQPAMMLFGALIGGFTAVLGYFFGSSASSKQKTEIMANGGAVQKP